MPSLTKLQSGFVEAQGALPLSSGTAAAPGLKFDDHAGTGMFSPSTGEIAFSTSGHSQAVTFKTDGKVGIGTDNPSEKLHVHTTGSGASYFHITNETTGSAVGDGVLLGLDSSEQYYIWSYENNNIVFGNNNTERLRITSDGNLGVGNDGSFPIYTGTNDRTLILGTGSEDSAIQIHSGTSNYGGIYFGDATSGSNRYRGYVEFKHGTSDDFLRFGTDAQERLRIASNGKVMMGQPSASINRNLSITGVTGNSNDTEIGLQPTNSSGGINPEAIIGATADGAYGAHMFFTTRDTSGNRTERLRITSDGKVGIGLTNPEKNLVVSSSSSPTIRINNSDSSITADQTIGVIEFKANDGSNDGDQVTGSIESIAQAAFTGQGSPSHLIFKTNGVSGANALTERLRITSAGLVGINDTNPERSVDIRANNCMVQLEGTGGGGRQYSLGSTDNTTGATAGSAGQFIIYDDTAGQARINIDSGGTIHINSADSASGGRLYAAGSKLYLQSGNGRQSFNIADMPSGSTVTHEFNSSGNLVLAGSASAKNTLSLTDTDTSARLNVQTDLSGNYTGWKEKGVASGSMSATSIASKTPTINDFTYPNNSNGMLIWSTSKIGFAAGSESPQYGTGVQMLFDNGGLILGGNRAFDRTTVSSTATNWSVRLRTSGIGEFKSTLYANPFSLTSSDSWIKSGYGAITNSTVQSLNNLMIAQNIRGHIQGIDGSTNTNNFYSVVTHGGMGYAGTEYCYGGSTKFYNGTGATTANTAFTPSTSMQINGNGIVTKPKNPSFAVTRNLSNWVISASTIFDYDTKIHDVGNDFSTSTHKFTCPVGGIYQFNFYSIFYGSTLSNAAVYMRKNGARIIGGDNHFSIDFSTARWNNVSYSISLSCSANDTVHMENGSLQVNYHGNHWHCFSGHLIG